MAGKKSAKQSEQKTDNTENIAMKADFDQLCRELNMDTSTADSAWNSYTEMKHKYTLEVRKNTLVLWQVFHMTCF